MCVCGHSSSVSTISPLNNHGSSEEQRQDLRVLLHAVLQAVPSPGVGREMKPIPTPVVGLRQGLGEV